MHPDSLYPLTSGGRRRLNAVRKNRCAASATRMTSAHASSPQQRWSGAGGPTAAASASRALLQPAASGGEAGVAQAPFRLVRTGEDPRRPADQLGSDLARDRCDDLAYAGDVALISALDFESPGRPQRACQPHPVAVVIGHPVQRPWRGRRAAPGRPQPRPAAARSTGRTCRRPRELPSARQPTARLRSLAPSRAARARAWGER